MERVVKTIRFPGDVLEEIRPFMKKNNLNFTGFVIEAIETISMGEPHALIGYSYGGLLAQALVRFHPERLKNLCLIAPRVMQSSDLKTSPKKHILYEENDFSSHLEERKEGTAEYLVVQEIDRQTRFSKFTYPCLEPVDVEFMERLEKRVQD